MRRPLAGLAATLTLTALLAAPAVAWNRTDALLEVEGTYRPLCDMNQPGPNCHPRAHPFVDLGPVTPYQVPARHHKLKTVRAFPFQVYFEGFEIVERECPDGTTQGRMETWKNHAQGIISTRGLEESTGYLPGWPTPPWVTAHGARAVMARRKDPCAGHGKKGRGRPRKCARLIDGGCLIPGSVGWLGRQPVMELIA